MTIEYCRAEELSGVMRFLDEHWRKGHIMAHDRQLMNFMHKNNAGGYDFAVAYEGGKIIGVLGFLGPHRYDNNLCDEDVWLVLWRSIGNIGVGVALMNEVCRHCTTAAAIGINDRVSLLYDRLGFKVDVLRHYYILNSQIKKFILADVRAEEHSMSREVDPRGAELIPLTEMDVLNVGITSCYYPKKSVIYLVNRYLKSPIYNYELFGVRNPGSNAISAIIVVRIVSCQGGRCIRMVDLLGDFSRCASISNSVQGMLNRYGCEYFDCLNYGISDSVFVSHGFSRLSGDDGVVIPNYFEPFVRENVTVKFALLNRTTQPYVVFKGDSDQDRPSRR